MRVVRLVSLCQEFVAREGALRVEVLACSGFTHPAARTDARVYIRLSLISTDDSDGATVVSSGATTARPASAVDGDWNAVNAGDVM